MTAIVKFYANAMGNPSIERVEVLRETASSVYLTGDRRRAKRGEWEAYCDTWQEAHQWLMQREERLLNMARMSLQRLQAKFGNVKGMKEPS